MTWLAEKKLTIAEILLKVVIQVGRQSDIMALITLEIQRNFSKMCDIVECESLNYYSRKWSLWQCSTKVAMAISNLVS